MTEPTNEELATLAASAFDRCKSTSGLEGDWVDSIGEDAANRAVYNAGRTSRDAEVAELRTELAEKTRELEEAHRCIALGVHPDALRAMDRTREESDQLRAENERLRTGAYLQALEAVERKAFLYVGSWDSCEEEIIQRAHADLEKALEAVEAVRPIPPATVVYPVALTPPAPVEPEGSESWPPPCLHCGAKQELTNSGIVLPHMCLSDEPEGGES